MDVLAAVAVLGGRLALGAREQRRAEAVDLGAVVVEVVLPGDLGAGLLDQLELLLQELAGGVVVADRQLGAGEALADLARTFQETLAEAYTAGESGDIAQVRALTRANQANWQHYLQQIIAAAQRPPPKSE